MNNFEKNHIQEITQSILMKKKTSFSWSFVLVFTGPLLAATILFALFQAGDTNPSSWVNWLIFAIFVPMILVSLVVGQKRQLVGSYGETILLLIPTFVWLLPGNTGTVKMMVTLSFGIVMFGLLIYMIAGLPKYYKFKNENNAHKITQILLRIGFVASTVTSTVIVSVILINWADFSLNLAPEDPKIPNRYSQSSWIAFISVVTITVALILVTLGLVTGMKKSHANTFTKNEFGFHPKKQKDDTRLMKTSLISRKKVLKFRKHNWWRKGK